MNTQFEGIPDPEPDSESRSASDRNRRAWIRSEVETSLRYLVSGSRELADACLYNCCPGGIYFESHLPMAPDSETTIVMPDLLAKSPVPDGYAVYRTKIRWCRELEKEQPHKFGIGAQFLEKQEAFVSSASPETFYMECDCCSQSLEEGCTCRIRDGVCLCLPCYRDLQKIPDGPVRQESRP